MRTEFWLASKVDGPLMTFEQVVDIIGAKPKTVRNWISDGTFPRPIPGGRFRVQDVATWIDDQAAASAA